jgi:hypothetical protein
MNQRQKLVQKQFLNNEEAVIERLKQVYGQSLNDINKKVKNLTFTIDELQEKYDWMDPDDPARAKVKSMIQSKIYQKRYQEQLQRQVEGILKQMETSQFSTIAEYLDKCYEDGFIGSIYDLQGQGVPLMVPIDQEAMVRAVQLESKISEGLYTKLGEDVALLKDKITAQISRAIATGMSYEQVAKQLAGCSKIGYNRAVRIARTEGHRIQCASTMDAIEQAKMRGADVLKQWDATLDGNTRPSHVALDGEIRDADKPFSNGLMYPGDPHGSAAEVVNCRCALLQRARWALNDDLTENGFTKFDRDSGGIKDFSGTEDYQEFRKKYLKEVSK